FRPGSTAIGTAAVKSGTVKPVRCAIYTRVSTDQGLEQDFNSLDAQHDAAEAYIRSQAHAGWTLIRARYDDGGYSGGSTERPALQQLLSDENVLLSFAQFEREVTSERIRDKIAASKRKGLWVGGMAPLGYETKNRKITVVEEEAEQIRIIFRRYLELGSINLVMTDLRKRGILTKVRSLSNGRT